MDKDSDPQELFRIRYEIAGPGGTMIPVFIPVLYREPLAAMDEETLRALYKKVIYYDFHKSYRVNGVNEDEFVAFAKGVAP